LCLIVGLARTEQPYFDIVRDPTALITAHQTHDEAKDNIERERWVYQESKKPLALDRLSKGNHKSVAKGGFSGAIYKRMLEAKEREINQLRKKLFDSMKMLGSESSNVHRLRAALNRSVNYYTFAEEWQQSESSRLQETVRYLKGETSALMAHLINAEEQKRLVSTAHIAQHKNNRVKRHD
jgi:hypothetical protein